VFTCAYAAKSGHLDILQWLRSQNPKCPWDVTVCNIANKTRNREILQWLKSQTYSPCPLNETEKNNAK
jgi:hypothetical protein